MTETKDRHKLGQTTFQASGAQWLDDGSDFRTVGSGEYKTLAAAKLAARSWLPKGATDFLIERGTYVDYVYEDDPEYGDIFDAEWREDESVRWHGFADKHGGIGWEQSGS